MIMLYENIEKFMYHIHRNIYSCIHPTLLLMLDVVQCHFLSGVQLVYNSEFSFFYTSCLNKARGLSLTYYLTIVGVEI